MATRIIFVAIYIRPRTAIIFISKCCPHIFFISLQGAAVEP